MGPDDTRRIRGRVGELFQGSNPIRHTSGDHLHSEAVEHSAQLAGMWFVKQCFTKNVITEHSVAHVKKRTIKLVRKLPPVANKIKSEKVKVCKQLHDDIHKMDKEKKFFTALPKDGLPQVSIFSRGNRRSFLFVRTETNCGNREELREDGHGGYKTRSTVGINIRRGYKRTRRTAGEGSGRNFTKRFTAKILRSFSTTCIRTPCTQRRIRRYARSTRRSYAWC